jgi:hypothetical protein
VAAPAAYASASASAAHARKDERTSKKAKSGVKKKKKAAPRAVAAVLSRNSASKRSLAKTARIASRSASKRTTRSRAARLAAEKASRARAHRLEADRERSLAVTPTLEHLNMPAIPFAKKTGEFLAGLRLGLWPAEKRRIDDPNYRNPDVFLVVAPSKRDTPVSEHFTIGEFAMHEHRDRTTIVVLRETLLKKLELVLTDLKARGIDAQKLAVLSGFRAPHYNGRVEGSAQDSRHQFGDAADIIVDNGNGRMADLNGDGRVDRNDIYVVADAIERVERRHPDLIGGLGLYDATGPSGPRLHIDVRGKPARWGPASRGPVSSLDDPLVDVDTDAIDGVFRGLDLEEPAP